MIWEKNDFSGRSNSKCKGSKAELSMFEEQKSSHWLKGTKQRVVVCEMKSDRRAGVRLDRALQAVERALDSSPSAVGSHLRCFK